jgi:hypothetical protein
MDEKLMRPQLITSPVFWFVTLHILLHSHHCDGDTCCLHFEGLLLNVMFI